MTVEERFERIEHITAMMAEERRKDREEYKSLWRDTQRQVDELARGMIQLRQHVDDLAVETRLRINELADSDKRLGDRMETLVSAIGQYIASQPKPRT